MVDSIGKEKYTFDDLVALVTLLRSPGGCPWDQAQTHASIRRNFLEEAYEACEAIDADDAGGLCEELGDVLLQVLFHADIERERGRFTIEDVADGICKKLIYRHPHVFSSQPEAQIPSWDALKRAEKGQTTTAETLVSVARTLPALWRAEKVLGKAEKAGFSIPDANALDQTIADQASSLCTLSKDDAAGSLLFAAVALCRRAGIDPEQALTCATDQFIERFSATETNSPVSSKL
ncbi:MAG: MazG family protein [Oscillospiraceae bacterium]|nr:MazG family protein [Oscillospiraceae bacterium]